MSAERLRPWYSGSLWQDWDFPWIGVDAEGYVAVFFTNRTDWAPFALNEMQPEDPLLDELLLRPTTGRALLFTDSGPDSEAVDLAERGVFVYDAIHDVGYVRIAVPEFPVKIGALEGWASRIPPTCIYPQSSWLEAWVSPAVLAPLVRNGT